MSEYLESIEDLEIERIKKKIRLEVQLQGGRVKSEQSRVELNFFFFFHFYI